MSNLTPVITSLTRDFRLHGNGPGGLVGMETIHGNGGALLHPARCPGMAALPKPRRPPSTSRPVTASLRASGLYKHACFPPGGVTTLQPVHWGGSSPSQTQGLRHRFCYSRLLPLGLKSFFQTVCLSFRLVRLSFRLPHSYYGS